MNIKKLNLKTFSLSLCLVALAFQSKSHAESEITRKIKIFTTISAEPSLADLIKLARKEIKRINKDIQDLRNSPAYGVQESLYENALIKERDFLKKFLLDHQAS